MDDIKRFNEHDEWILQKVQQLIDELSNTLNGNPAMHPKYQIDNGLLKYKSRVVLSLTSHWR